MTNESISSGKNAKQDTSFAEYLLAELELHNLSQNRLASALKGKISQKTINRYTNGDLPNKEYEQIIRDYFYHVEHDGLKPGEPYVDTQKLNEIFSDGYDDPDFDYMKEFGLVIDDSVYEYSDWLKYYHRDIQEYIVDHFEFFAYVGAEDILFIENYHKLTPSAKKWLENYLSNVPISLGLVLNVENDLEDQWYMKRYLEYMNKTDEEMQNGIYSWNRLKSSFNDTNSTNKKMMLQPTRKVYEQFKELSINYYLNHPDTKEKIGERFFSNFDKLFLFTDQDWFILYLYRRALLFDYCPDGVTNTDGCFSGMNAKVIDLFFRNAICKP